MSTYTPIATQTLGGTASSVTFSSIPQGYTDLVLIVAGLGSNFTSVALNFNSDTGSNYSRTVVDGNGTSTTSDRETSQTKMRVGVIDGSQGTNIIQIMNYCNTTTNKTVLTRGSAAGNLVRASVGLWRNTAAITALDIAPNSGTFSTGTTFSIYGIQVGDKAQKAQGGNIVTTDGTYVYHTFNSSGAFIPNQALTADYLVVAGGGSGGNNIAGGGGAGGYRTSIGGTPLSLTAISYPVIIGAGGAINTTQQERGVSGSNSVFSTITSSGGGAGGGNSQTPLTGGSGGGGSGAGAGPYTGASGNAGSYSPSEGNSGGTGGTATFASAGGGGGASANGTAGSNSANTGSQGGAGSSNSISGTSVTYGGGGGGGSAVPGTSIAAAGGAGGGGAGGFSNNTPNTANNNNTAGTANTGGGGGGAAWGSSELGKQGGSGVVVIRYLA